MPQLATASCELDRVGGGVDIAIAPTTDTIVVIGPGLRIFRSADGGLSYSDRWLEVEGSWPSVAFRGDDLFVAAGRWGEPNEIFLLHSTDCGVSFDPPLVAFSATPNLVVDPELLVLADGRLMLFFTEIVPASGGFVFTVHVLRTDDDGWTWQQLPDAIVGPAGTAKIEDAKAIELSDGVLLVAYEYEIEDLAASRIEQIRSHDGGMTWQQPTVIWDDVAGADNEPGGYLRLGPDELWFLASTDEDWVETYQYALVKRKVSTDGGESWRDKATLVDELDQIVFGAAMAARGTVALATVRSFSSPPRMLSIYHVDPQLPGLWYCRPPIFSDGFDDGGAGRWSAVHP